MDKVTAEILALEERLRRAELGPDPAVFQELLDDEVVLSSQEGAAFAKSQVIEAHRPGKMPKFTRVEMSGFAVTAHGDSAAVLTCAGTYATAQGAFTLKFMRVWLKKDGRWRVIAGSVSK